MKQTLLVLAFFFTAISAKAQNKNAMVTVTTIDSGKIIFTSVEKAPEFPGGLPNFYKFLSAKLVYPQTARKNNTQGRVIIQFIVEGDGSLTHLNVVRGVSKEIDEEALRVLSLCPKWSPGMQNGEKVRCSYTVPISFSLAK